MLRCLTVAVAAWVVTGQRARTWGNIALALAGPNFEPGLAGNCMDVYCDRTTAHLLFDIKVGKWRRKSRL